MIHLKEFNSFNSFFSFDPLTGHAHSVPKRDDGFSGFFSILPDGQLAALYKEKDIVTLQIGKNRWRCGSMITTSHKHVDGGKTIFSIYSDDGEIYEYEYPSWWLNSDLSLPPALGELANDEEDDFLGYVHSVFEDEKKGIKRGLSWHNVN